MHIPLCHAERGQKGPSATDLEQSGLGESINTNHSKRKVQLMLIMKTSSVLHCWDKHFLDSKYKYLLDLKHYICQCLKMSNQPGLKTNRNLIRKVSAQSPAEEGVIGFIYFCKYGCSYDMPVTLCTAKWNVGLEVRNWPSAWEHESSSSWYMNQLHRSSVTTLLSSNGCFKNQASFGLVSF